MTLLSSQPREVGGGGSRVQGKGADVRAVIPLPPGEPRLFAWKLGTHSKV